MGVALGRPWVLTAEQCGELSPTPPDMTVLSFSSFIECIVLFMV